MYEARPSAEGHFAKPGERGVSTPRSLQTGALTRPARQEEEGSSMRTRVLDLDGSITCQHRLAAGSGARSRYSVKLTRGRNFCRRAWSIQRWLVTLRSQ